MEQFLGGGRSGSRPGPPPRENLARIVGLNKSAFLAISGIRH
jgi:hypothetical protein